MKSKKKNHKSDCYLCNDSKKTTRYVCVNCRKDGAEFLNDLLKENNRLRRESHDFRRI